MPLFFIIAGITYRQKAVISFLIGKINRIMIPWTFWSIISAIFSLIPHGYGGPFNGPLWFLYDIFVALIIVYLISLLNHKYLKISFTCLLLLSFVIINNTVLSQVLPFGIPLALISSQFIIIGKVLQKRKLFSSHSKIRTILFLIFLIGLFCIVCHYLTTHGVRGNYVSLKLFKSNFIGSYLAGIAGSLVVIFVSIIIQRHKILEWMGRQSLVIMCVHFPFCMLWNRYLDNCTYFTTSLNKLILVSCEWLTVMAISCGICIICSYFMPRLTGYKPLLKYSRGQYNS